MKQVTKGVSRGNVSMLPKLNSKSYKVKLIHLIRTERKGWDLGSPHVKGPCISTISGIVNADVEVNWIWFNHAEWNKQVRKDLNMTSRTRELRDCLREAEVPPKNLTRVGGSTRMIIVLSLGEQKFCCSQALIGNGTTIVRIVVGRVVAHQLDCRRFSTKAGLREQTTRGSGENGQSGFETKTMNIGRIANMKNLITAYEEIKSNPGNMTRGTSAGTLDGVNMKYFEELQKKLRAGTYRFPPARRIQIPKPGKAETRPLTIASPRDKIVQKAIQQVMNEVYEPRFLDTSHGFRPNRGTHTAIQYVEAKFQSVQFIIEADFTKAFDSIQHKKLMRIIERDCGCDKTLNLIKSGLKAGYVELGELHNTLGVGTPQGSILSPLLCNVFLHKLDEFIEELKREYNKGTKKPRNKEYERIQNRVKYMKKKGYDKLRPEEFQKNIELMKRLPSVE